MSLQEENPWAFLNQLAVRLVKDDGQEDSGVLGDLALMWWKRQAPVLDCEGVARLHQWSRLSSHGCLLLVSVRRTAAAPLGAPF